MCCANSYVHAVALTKESGRSGALVAGCGSIFFAKQKRVTKLLEQNAGTNDLRYLVQWGIRDNNEYIIPQHYGFLMISEKLWGKMRNNDKQ